MKALLVKWRRIPREKQVYILPTAFGLIFGGAIAGLMMYGVVFQSTVVIAAGLILFLLALLAMVETHVNVREVSLQLEDCVPVEAGRPGSVRFRLESNESAWGLMLQMGGLKSLKDLVTFQSHRTNLESESQTAVLDVATKSRGLYRYPEVVIASLFPFGLFRAWKRVIVVGTQVVYPTPRGLSYRDFMRFVSTNTSPDAIKSLESMGQETEFKQHKEWQIGDSALRMDWRASQRHGVKLIRMFEEESSKGARSFSWKDTPGTTVEARLEQLSKWAHEAEAEQLSYRMDLPHITIGFGRGDSHWRRVMTALASFPLKDEGGMP